MLGAGFRARADDAAAVTARSIRHSFYPSKILKYGLSSCPLLFTYSASTRFNQSNAIIGLVWTLQHLLNISNTVAGLRSEAQKTGRGWPCANLLDPPLRGFDRPCPAACPPFCFIRLKQAPEARQFVRVPGAGGALFACQLSLSIVEAIYLSLTLPLPSSQPYARFTPLCQPLDAVRPVALTNMAQLHATPYLQSIPNHKVDSAVF